MVMKCEGNYRVLKSHGSIPVPPHPLAESLAGFYFIYQAISFISPLSGGCNGSGIQATSVLSRLVNRYIAFTPMFKAALSAMDRLSAARSPIGEIMKASANRQSRISSGASRERERERERETQQNALRVICGNTCG